MTVAAAEPDVPPEGPPPRRRRWRPRLPLGPAIFVLVLGSLSGVKQWHNARQLAHQLALPQRTRAYVDRYQQMRQAFAPALAANIDSDLEHLRAAVDPGGKADGYRNWSTEQHGADSAVHTYHDPANDRTLKMYVTAGALKSAWVATEPFVDHPIAFWAVGEGARKLTGMFGGLLWAAAAIGAYREPLLRRKLAPAAMACALVALAAWSLEPPTPIRDPGFRVPAGPYVGAALVLLTIPALVLARRGATATGRCRRCNYDLTGNLSGVCPECGEPTRAEARRRRIERAATFATALEAEPAEDALADASAGSTEAEAAALDDGPPAPAPPLPPSPSPSPSPLPPPVPPALSAEPRDADALA